MDFHLVAGRGLKSQVRRLLADQCALALRAAQGRVADPVHVIRTCGKRSRALLRLVRPAVKKQVFKRTNHAWRDIGRLLSADRDRTVARACLVEIRKRQATALSTATVRAALSALAGQTSGSPPTPAKKTLAKSLRIVRRDLKALRKHLRTLPLESAWSHVVAGFSRGQAAWVRSSRLALHARAGTTARHTWRKRTKDLRHQAQLLEPLAPTLCAPRAAGWKELGDRLGKEQDVALTCQHLAGMRPAITTRPVLAAAYRWQRELRRASNRLAKRLLETPAISPRQMQEWQHTTG